MSAALLLTSPKGTAFKACSASKPATLNVLLIDLGCPTNTVSQQARLLYSTADTHVVLDAQQVSCCHAVTAAKLYMSQAGLAAAPASKTASKDSVTSQVKYSESVAAGSRHKSFKCDTLSMGHLRATFTKDPTATSPLKHQGSESRSNSLALLLRSKHTVASKRSIAHTL